MVPFLLLLACHGSIQHSPGVQEARLAPCPSSPNCVSSFAAPSDEEHYLAPLPLQGRSADAALDQLEDWILDQPRTRVIDRDGPWLHASFTSLVWRFTDDVELYVDEDAGLLHFRSSSRVGRSDMGVNRRRMERLREAWLQ